MPLRYFKNKDTEEIIKTLKGPPEEGEWVEVIKAPNSKFMEKTDKFKGKSRIRGITKVLIERSRNHSRDNDLADNIAINRDNNLQGVKSNFLNKNGQRRRKIDDI